MDRGIGSLRLVAMITLVLATMSVTEAGVGSFPGDATNPHSGEPTSDNQASPPETGAGSDQPVPLSQVELERKVYFFGKESGKVVPADPGIYLVKALDEGHLRLERSDGHDVVIPAERARHNEELTTSVAAAKLVVEDELHIVLFRPDGTVLDAVGNHSGVVSRGGLRVTQGQYSLSASRMNLAMPVQIRPPTTEEALEGAVPFILHGTTIPQGRNPDTRGSVVKDHMWVVPGASSDYRSTKFTPGIRGVITRMTADSTTGATGMITTYTLYKNGVQTGLSCISSGSGSCEVNWNVPIDVGDHINIAVELPKTQVCASTGYDGCAPATPIITLMLRMGG